MLMELQIIKDSPYPLTPKEVAKKTSKSESTVRVNLHRAWKLGKIQRTSYGSYANLKYVPAPTTEETDWKNCKYTMLLQIFLNLIQLDDEDSFNELEYLARRTLNTEEQALLRDLLNQARKDLKI